MNRERERPKNAELESPLGTDVVVGGEIARLRPLIECIRELHEDTGPVPLDVGEDIHVGEVADQFALLRVELAQVRTVGRRIPERVRDGVDTELQVHHVAHDIDVEIPAQIERQLRQRQDIVGRRRELEEHLVVEVQAPYREILAQVGAHHAHRLVVLPDHRQRVVVQHVGHQRIAELRVEPPLRNLQLRLDLGRGYLREIIVPLVVVQEDLLLEGMRRLEAGMELGHDMDALRKRVERHAELCVDVEIEHAGAREIIVRVGAPGNVFLELPRQTAVDIEIVLRIPFLARQVVGGLEGIGRQELIADAGVDLGQQGVGRIGLQLDEEAVLQVAHRQFVGRTVLVDVELVEVKVAPVGVARADFVGVELAVGSVFAAVADVGHSAFTQRERVAVLAEEVERDGERLVDERAAALVEVVRAGQVDRDGLGLHGRIPDPEGILDTAVLLALDALADMAKVREVALAHVVAQDEGVAVIGVLVGEHAAGTQAPVGEREVELRRDVLRGAQPKVLLFEVLGGQRRTPETQLGVGHLGVELLDRLVGIGVADIRSEHRRVDSFLALEPVVVERRGAGRAEVGAVDVLLHHRRLVEIAVGRRVEMTLVVFVETLVGSPDEQAAVVQRVGDDVGLQDARLGGAETVALFLPDAAHGPLDVARIGQVARNGVEIGPGERVELGQGGGVDLVPEDIVQRVVDGLQADGIRHAGQGR